MGQTDTETHDSLLAFYDPASGSLKRKVKLPLADVSGLAYRPKTHTLFATDVAWKTPRQGGLFAVSLEGDVAKTTKIATLDKPTAWPSIRVGHLYVSVLGTGENGRHPPAPLYFKPGL